MTCNNSKPLASLAACLVGLVALAACGGGGAGPDGDPGADAALPHTCELADCEDGHARTCDQDPLSLDCSAFSAACADFVTTDGTEFAWCDCGSLAEGEGQCLSGRNGATCEGGLGLVAECVEGTRCIESPGDPFGLACECDGLTDGVCPDAVCTNDADCTSCTPDCSGQECGDNGCGGQCGSCAFGETCSATGQCVSICVPDCAGKQCGSDGCGGSCGTCDGTCTASGQCEGTCVPDCTGKVCGSDGCSGSCGSCTDGLECQSNGTCGCGFFDTVTYTFTLDPAATWPPSFSFLGLNVNHIDLDGTDENNDGAFLSFANGPSFTFTTYGCEPHIRIKRDYAVSGHSCQATETFTDRTTFVIPPPIIDANGNCTAPPL